MELAAQERKVTNTVQEQVDAFWKDGQYGYVPREKPNNTIRLLYENFNSLGVFATGKARRRKVNRLKQLLREYGADILAGCETQVDWRYATEENDKFHNLFGKGQERKSVIGFNRTGKKMGRAQNGGTAMITFGRLSASVTETGVDDTGLGRFSWMKLSGGGKTTRVVTVYNPCEPQGETAGTTTWDQQASYFEAKGDGRSPRTILFE